VNDESVIERRREYGRERREYNRGEEITLDMRSWVSLLSFMSSRGIGNTARYGDFSFCGQQERDVERERRE